MAESFPILVACGERDQLDTMSSALASAGYPVTRALSGQEALRAARSSVPELLLLCVHLPDGDGIDLCRQIKDDETLADAGVILVHDSDLGAGHQERLAAFQAAGLAAGASGCLVWPQPPQAFLAHVRALVCLRHAEKALRESEQRFRSVAQSASDAILSADEEGQIVFWNRAAQTMFGYGAQDTAGVSLLALLAAPHECSPARGRPPFDWADRARSLGKTTDWWGKRRDGTCFPIEFSLSDWQGGGQTWYTIIIRDTAERMRTVDALRQERDFAESLIETAQALVLVLDVEGRIVRFNSFMEQVSGYRLDEVRGQRATLFLPQPERRSAAARLAQLLAVEEVQTFTGRIIARDGLEREIEWRVRALHSAGGKELLGLLLVGRDVTERQQAERERQRLYEQTLRDAEIKNELLQEVNHRVKNNLAALLGLLYAQQRYAGEGKGAAYHAVLRELTGRIEGLAVAHDMLSAAGWAPVSVVELAQQIIRAATRALPGTRRIHVDAPSSPVQVTPGQANDLALVFNELAANAVAHGLARRGMLHITVRASEDEAGQVSVLFQDDGPGFPNDVLCLERYGAGLYLVRTLVSQGLGGKLVLRNAPGAVAEVSFPAGMPPAAQEP
jgi:PAS domain S-box-containing protein